MGGPPKCEALRWPNTPMVTCASRHAIVVTGGGVGSGNSQSMTKSPAPAAIVVRASARGRTLQQSATGSQKHSSSVSPVSRGRTCASQCHVSCSSASSCQATSMAPTYAEPMAGPRESFDALDEPWQAALGEAWRSWASGCAGVGAVVSTSDGRIVTVGRNRMIEERREPGVLASTALAHAEMNALAVLQLGPTD